MAAHMAADKNVALTVTGMTGDVRADVQTGMDESLDDLNNEAAAAIGKLLPDSHEAVIQLLKDTVILAGAATVAESGLVDGDSLQFVLVTKPKVRILPRSSESWTNAPGQQGPALKEGELAIVTTSVGREEGTAPNVTRQCLKSSRPYTIHFCNPASGGARPSIADSQRSVEKESHIIAVIHRQIGKRHGGCVIDVQVSTAFRAGRYSTLFLFEGGFPNGGECYADVHAPWGNCYTCVPIEGSVIIEVPWEDAVTVPGSA